MEILQQEAQQLCDTETTSSSTSPDGLSLKNQHSGWTGVLLLTAVSTTVGSAVSSGYNIGVIDTPSSLIKQWCNSSMASFDLTATQLELLWSTIVSVFIVGGAIGSLVASWCADYVGRKGALAITDVLFIISAAMYLSCKLLSSIGLLLMARFIAGLASGLTMSVMPMYLMELAPDSKKGAVAALTPFGITFGVFLGQFMSLDWLLGRESSWHILLSLYLLLVLASAVVLPVMPESPKYLYFVRRDKQLALRELTRLRSCSIVKVAGELEGVPVERPWTVLSVLSTPGMRLPLVLVCALQAGQQFSGINAVFFYSSYIFKSVGLSATGRQYATLGAGAVNFFIAMVMVPVVNCCRRRPLIQLSCSLAAATLMVLAISINYLKTVPWMGFISIFSVLLYVLFYGCGLGPIPYFIGSELFEVGPRPAAMALGSAANWSGNLIVGLTFPTLNHFLNQYVFLIFAASTMVLLVFISLKLPETFNQVDRKDGTKEEIERVGQL